MINLDSGANTVYVTLKEKATLTNPYYVFVFINDQTLKKYMVTATDVSSSTAKRSEFTLTIQASPNWLSGQLLPDNYGDYTYYVYEKSANPSTLTYNTVVNADIRNYVPTYFTSLVETGKMKYGQPTATDYTYKTVEDIGKAYVPSV